MLNAIDDRGISHTNDIHLNEGGRHVYELPFQGRWILSPAGDHDTDEIPLSSVSSRLFLTSTVAQDQMEQ